MYANHYGRARGMKLLPPKDYAVRPTSDRVKEALFNIIKDRIAGAVVLDAFGGTGNLALEAWSRGQGKSSSLIRTAKACGSFVLM